jgi:hypothetical protein
MKLNPDIIAKLVIWDRPCCLNSVNLFKGQIEIFYLLPDGFLLWIRTSITSSTQAIITEVRENIIP